MMMTMTSCENTNKTSVWIFKSNNFNGLCQFGMNILLLRQRHTPLCGEVRMRLPAMACVFVMIWNVNNFYGCQKDVLFIANLNFSTGIFLAALHGRPFYSKAHAISAIHKKITYVYRLCFSYVLLGESNIHWLK